eukprot:350645-Chlamydomonas_euryale.AAC.1
MAVLPALVGATTTQLPPADAMRCTTCSWYGRSWKAGGAASAAALAFAFGRRAACPCGRSWKAGGAASAAALAFA